MRIDISISMRPMTTKYGKQVHLGELMQMRPIKQVMMMSLLQSHVTNLNHPYHRGACSHQTWQDGNLP